MKNNLLIADDVHAVMLDKFTAANIHFDYLPHVSREEAMARIAEYDGLVIRSKFQVDASFLESAPNLKVIARVGAGMDNIDESFALKKGITLLPANEGNMDAVGEHMIGMLLSLMNNLTRANLEVKNGFWKREENRGHELKGKTVGLIGYGHNGQATAKKLSGFEVDVIAYDKYKTDFSDEYAREVSMEILFEKADIVSFHIPLTDETRNMITQSYLSKFKKPIYFLLGARGGIVEMNAVIEALDNKQIIGAAFDVLPIEKFPKLGEQNWFEDIKKRDNVLLSPHIAGWSVESYYKLAAIAADKILDFYGKQTLIKPY